LPEIVAVDVADDVRNFWNRTHPLDHPHSATTFQWEDVDFGLKFPCGVVKCFLSSLTNPEHGYLMWEQGTRGLSLSEARRTYDYARLLEAKYHVRQFFTSSPFEVTNIPEKIRSRLSDAERGYPLRPLAELADDVVLIVQPSRTAPTGSVVFKCRPFEARLSSAWPADPVIVARNRGNYRLMREFAYTLAVMKAEPALARDYQIMVDPAGRVYHLDLDRTLRGKRGKLSGSVEKERTCMLGAIGYIQKYVNEGHGSAVSLLRNDTRRKSRRKLRRKSYRN